MDGFRNDHTKWHKPEGERQMYHLYVKLKRCAAAAESLQSCPTLCGPTDGSPPGSPVPGILQARTLEWVAISFCNAWKWKVKVKSLSRVRLLATPWTANYQAPPSIGFSRQEYWSGSPLPSPTGLKKQKEVCSRDTGASDPGVSLAGLHVVDFQNIFVDWVSLPNFLQ